VNLFLPFGAELVRSLVQVRFDAFGRCETTADAFLADVLAVEIGAGRRAYRGNWPASAMIR
jgi:hypothetical protein